MDLRLWVGFNGLVLNAAAFGNARLLSIEGRTLFAGNRFGREDYNEGVRYYTTKPLNGCIALHCIFCEHSVATVDFDRAKGNRRTQAAAAINQHVRELHSAQLRSAQANKLGGRGGL